MLSNSNLLRDFVGISTWQTLVSVVIFIGLQIGFWFFLKKIKLKFVYRVLSGFGLGLFFGIVIQSIIGFLPQAYFDGALVDGTGIGDIPPEWITVPFYDPSSSIFWVHELNNWVQFFRRVFINGVTLLLIPIVFLAIFRVASKVGERGIARITIKGILLLLTNVAFAFTVTFFLGIIFNVGQGFNIVESWDGWRVNDDRFQSIVIPNLISGYFPTNIFTAIAGTSIIPVIIIAALAGTAVKILSKKKSVEMQAVRKVMETGWDIVMSILMIFMKFMPLAVMSMISVALISRPIGELVHLGRVIGIGYLGLFIAVCWLSLIVFLSGLKLSGWWKKGWRPFIQGFSTQSSNATLPTTIDTMKNDFKINETVVGAISPLTTSMGMMACAGVQTGLATSLLWTGATDGIIQEMGLLAFFITGLVVTMIASFGIAGIPGTATVVTVGVLGGLGFIAYVDSILGIIAPLDGLFDMGRTAVNVLGGVAVVPIVAKTEGMIGDGSPLLSEKLIIKQNKILQQKQSKYDYFILMSSLQKDIENELKNKDLTSENKLEIKTKFSEKKKDIKLKHHSELLSINNQYAQNIKDYNLKRIDQTKKSK